ncbi:efflux RND transporter periplasmic adaptor subunit [Peristeroidobacter soli]|uniref:efflux RND transporter periplasmic adaptor subunit n=1 Tax=Peristeroidobacter soli TaxID=2497877 RepID=UPI00101D2EC2|nr:efflux RND transporter periplasmic adaptor subunit [Peristeroidobacter soli]
MPRPSSRFMATAGVVTVVFALAGCAQEAPPPPPAPDVIVETVQRSDLPLAFEYPARVAGSRVVEVRARVSGVIVERSYREGQPVKAGDLLFRIEPDNYRAAHEQAGAEVQMQRAAITQARSDYERAKALVAEGAVSKREYDQAEAAFLRAQGGLAAAEAAQKIARLNLDYTEVRSPVTGVASKEAVTVGNLVNGAATAGGDLLTTVIQADPAYVEFSIAEAELLRLRELLERNSKQTQYPVRIVRGSSCESTGKLDFADTFVNTSTGTVRARAVFPNQSGCLVSGQYLAIELSGVQIADALAVSKAAVLFAQTGPMVWVVGNDNKVSPRPVQIQESWRDRWIVQEGVQPGERVIVEGLLKVRPGVEVVALTKEQEAARKAAKDQPAAGAGKGG